MEGFKKIINEHTPLIELNSELFDRKKVKVVVKADYLTHPEISGNKWRKMKHNLLKARELGYEKLLTFGGAFSNHIAATASSGKAFGFETLGIIRGNELNETSSKTLQQAAKNGMKFRFVSRSDYRNKALIIKEYLSEYYCLPEGGTNTLALVGVSEMVDDILAEIKPDYLLSAMGTGGTVAGILSNESYKGKVIGVPVLKNAAFLKNEIMQLLDFENERLELHLNYHFGGYGKWNDSVLSFMELFQKNFDIPLDKVYTAKAAFALIDLIQNDYFPENSVIVFYHSGGLQGN